MVRRMVTRRKTCLRGNGERVLTDRAGKVGGELRVPHRGCDASESSVPREDIVYGRKTHDGMTIGSQYPKVGKNSATEN